MSAEPASKDAPQAQEAKTAPPADRLAFDYAQTASLWRFVNDKRHATGSVNFGTGFPSWPAPQFVKDAAIGAITSDLNQYVQNDGYPPLMEALVEYYTRRLGLPRDDIPTLDKSNILPTVGCCAALSHLCQAFLNPGDEIVIIEPLFSHYHVHVAQAQGVMRTVSLDLRQRDGGEWEWTLDVDRLRAAFNSRTRLFLLNTPNNPTGYVMDAATQEAVAAVVRDFPQVVVAVDEVYEHVVYDGHEHVRFQGQPGMFERTLTLSSASKTFSITGWRLGWACGPAHLVKPLYFVARAVYGNAPTPFQAAIASVLPQAESPYEGQASYYAWLRAMFQRKRDLVVAAIRAAGMVPIVPQGGYFCVADARKQIKQLMALRGLTEADVDPDDQTTLPDWRFVAWLMEEESIRVACAPLSPFTAGDCQLPDRNGYLRFACCLDDAVIEDTARRLRNVPRLLADS